MNAGAFHISDIIPQGDSNKCCFLYGGCARNGKTYASLFDQEQCDKPVKWKIKSTLREALICDYHRKEIEQYHRGFDPETIVEEIK